jgi:hypothetical protein
VLLPFSSPSPPSLSLLPVPFLPSPSLLPTAAATPFPVWPASVCFLPCVRRGNATQRELARATVLYSKRPRKRSPHFLHVPLVLNRLVHLASPSPRCVTRYVTNGRFPPPPPRPHHYQTRVFFCAKFRQNAKNQKLILQRNIMSSYYRRFCKTNRQISKRSFWIFENFRQISKRKNWKFYFFAFGLWF